MAVPSSPSITIQQWLKDAEKSLLNITPAAQQDAALLLTHCLQQSFAYLITHYQNQLTPPQQQHANDLLQQALTGKPIAYILGHTEFYGLSLIVNQHALIPRSATECLVDWILAHLPNQAMTIADCGTGSGAIACALASNRAAWQVTAIDQGLQTLEVAKINAEKLGLKDQITFIKQNWLNDLQSESFDMIVSNPPYIDPLDSDIDQQVLQFEPAQALFAADQGLQDIQVLIHQAFDCLKPNGKLILEHGHKQQQAVITLLERAHFTTIQGHQDLSGLDRFISAQKPAD